MQRIINGILVLVIFSFGVFTLTSCEKEKDPKNVILLIADGCGYNQVNAASLYQYGETGRQLYEQFPVVLAMSTFPANGIGYDPDSAWVSFDYVLKKPTDSAASATAMSSGEKTNNGTIGQDTLQQPLETMVEHMEKRGKSTGVVTSVPFPHATPAAFLAHNDSRGHYSEIAREMILQTGVDVIMGAGHPEYDVDGKTTTDTSYRYVGGYDLWQKLKAGQVATDADGDGIPDTWTLIQERSEFQELANGETPKRLIGVPLVGSTLQLERFMASETGTPYSVPFIESVPTLAEMSLAALNVLDNNKNGFFLMIEGGGVDWASHANHLGRMIEEEIEFNKTIEAVYAWVEENSSWDETLIIITGDHETGYLTGPGSNPDSTGSDPVLEDIWKPLVNNGKGEVPGAQWHTGGHVNSLIPFYSKGAGSARFVEAATRVDLVRGNFLDNTDIGKILKSFQ